MDYSKEVISKIAGIENWGEFEDFVKSLYEKNEGTLYVERSYKAKGKSGRRREVDVLVKFGFNPHIISLGIECKYWSQKVDGDIIDIASAKKEDLNLDKYAVITTIGFEAGAEIYAKSKGIDLFVIRPSEDDDFGHSGRVIKFKLYLQGSRPVNIGFNASIVADQGTEQIALSYVQSKLSNINFDPEKEDELDPELDLYRYTLKNGQNSLTEYTRGAYVNNFKKLLLETWRTQNTNFWSGQRCSIPQKIIFKEPTALFSSRRILVLLSEVNFNMQYLKSESEFDIDRGEQYPMVLENVIERAITPLKSSLCADGEIFSMCESEPKQEIDPKKKPEDAIGRDGAWITLLCKHPMSISASDLSVEHYELIQTGISCKWEKIN